MKLMHTKLPEFISKIKMAVAGRHPGKEAAIRGIENIRSANFQSLRTGRIAAAAEELGDRPDVARVECVVMPRIPETMHTVIVKGLDAEGNPKRAILEVVNILQPTEEVELEGCPEVDDRRPPLGKH